MKNPLFSIVVSVYNTEKYLGELIESVKNQTDNDWELILVDDGSTDGSLEKCKSYENEKIHAYHMENGGMTAAVYYGISKSTGDYIIVADADDVMDIGCLRKVGSIIKNTECDIVIYGFRTFGDESVECQLPLVEGRLYGRKEIIKAITENEYYALWNKAIKGSIVRNNCSCNLDNILMNNDIAMIFPFLTKIKKGFVLHDVLYEYRYHGRSVSHNITCNKIIDAGRTIGYALDTLDYACLLENGIKKSLFNTYAKQLATMFNLIAEGKNILEDFEVVREQKTYQEFEEYEMKSDISSIKKVGLFLFRKHKDKLLKYLLSIWGLIE